MSLVPLGEHLERAIAAAGREHECSLAPRAPPINARLSAASSSYLPHLRHLSSFGGRSCFADPFFVIPLPDGGCCVSDHGHAALQVLSQRGELIRTISLPPPLTSPLGLALGEGTLFVASQRRICQLSFEAELLGSFGEAELADPCGLALGCAGRLFVTDCARDCVCVFEASCAGAARADAALDAAAAPPSYGFAYSIGGPGSGAGLLSDPRGIAAHEGRVWVADMGNHRVQAFSECGRHLRSIGRYGDGAAEFRYPSGVAITSWLLLVSEFAGARLHVLSCDGVFLQVLPSPQPADGLRGCFCAAAALASTVYVSDSESYVHVYAVERKGPDAAQPGAASRAQPVPAQGAPPPPRASGVEETTREERVSRAQQAASLKEMLDTLTLEDIQSLLPAAYADFAEHPEHYQVLPLLPSARPELPGTSTGVPTAAHPESHAPNPELADAA